MSLLFIYTSTPAPLSELKRVSSFVPNCNSRKQAECLAREMGALAMEIAGNGGADYRFECDAN